MTPKEKAIELVLKYEKSRWIEHSLAVKCALIAVDEVLDSIDWDYYEGANQTEHMYWQEIKQEIEAL